MDILTLNWWEVLVILAALIVAFIIGRFTGFRAGVEMERERIISIVGEDRARARLRREAWRPRG